MLCSICIYDFNSLKLVRDGTDDGDASTMKEGSVSFSFSSSL